MAARLFRRVTPVIHKLDHAIGRLHGRRRVLVELRTPVYHAVLAPVADALANDPGVDVWFTSEYPDRIRPLVGAERFRTRANVEWRRFHLYLNADPWAAANLRRCAHRVTFFHGVAGKYDLDRPDGLPMDFARYDAVAFINGDRLQRYVDAKIVTPAQAALVGYPKLDRLVRGEIDAKAIRRRLALDAGRPTALYAPTYSEASSLHLAGEGIVRALAAHGFNVVVKLHDRSLDADPKYHGGVNWRARMKALERPGRVRYVEQADATPLLAAADVMVTDHSSVGFEFLVLDRPLLVFDAPDLPRAARINPEKVTLLRSAATLVRSPEEVGDAAAAALAYPDRLSAERRRVARDLFYEPGTATDRALALVRRFLDAGRDATAAANARDRGRIAGDTA